MRDVYMTAQVEDDLSRQLLLMETYDQTYDIYDHERMGKPMAVISMHPAEDVITGSRLKTVARELVALRLPEITNTPLVELMNYPRWLLDDLITDARKAKVQEDTTTKQFEQQLGMTR